MNKRADHELLEALGAPVPAALLQESFKDMTPPPNVIDSLPRDKAYPVAGKDKLGVTYKATAMGDRGFDVLMSFVNPNRGGLYIPMKMSSAAEVKASFDAIRKAIDGAEADAVEAVKGYEKSRGDWVEAFKKAAEAQTKG